MPMTNNAQMWGQRLEGLSCRQHHLSQFPNGVSAAGWNW
jgi:hypothetical protein